MHLQRVVRRAAGVHELVGVDVQHPVRALAAGQLYALCRGGQAREMVRVIP
jgi:hypothetical protein